MNGRDHQYAALYNLQSLGYPTENGGIIRLNFESGARREHGLLHKFFKGIRWHGFSFIA